MKQTFRDANNKKEGFRQGKDQMQSITPSPSLVNRRF